MGSSIYGGQWGTDDIADSAITTAKINDLAVTTAKLANSSVNANKIQAGQVTNAALTATAVTASKIPTSQYSTVSRTGLGGDFSGGGFKESRLFGFRTVQCDVDLVHTTNPSVTQDSITHFTSASGIFDAPLYGPASSTKIFDIESSQPEVVTLTINTDGSLTVTIWSTASSSRTANNFMDVEHLPTVTYLHEIL